MPDPDDTPATSQASEQPETPPSRTRAPDPRTTSKARPGTLAAHMGTDRQCTATSKQTGERCRRIVPYGHVVCKFHGGNTAAAKNKARLRLLELVEPAVAQLARLMVNSPDERVQLRAIENVLDRAGLPRGVKIDGQDARAFLVARLETYRAENGLDDADFTAASAKDTADLTDPDALLEERRS